ncbi:MAG: flagellar capping protein [Lachnospiraceae bacterium]|nr:flagellar capping protein [Lachnospiraceae bacterium]
MAGFALTNIYNNFLTTYAPKSSRYDNHKRGELKSIYESIVKQSKESPLFLIDYGTETTSYAVNMKENARELKNVISSLSSEDTMSVLDKKTAYSSNEDIVTAKYIGESNSSIDPDDVPSFEISVKQLASSQVNLGRFIPEGGMDLVPDTYSFDIEINDTDYEFQFNVEAADTNKDMQEKLARLINRSNIGVTASVESDGSGLSALRLDSTATGTQADGRSIFSVSDDNTSKASGAVEYFGLSDITSPSSNAVFSLNGSEHSAYSNSFTIDKVYEINLKGLNDEDSPVTVGLRPDIESLVGNISGLVNGYNDFMRRAAEYTESYGRSTKFNSEMNSIRTLYQNELDAVGLSFDENGLLDVNKKLLAQSAGEGDPHDTLKAITNFTNTLVDKAAQISLNPMNYTSRVVVEYKNPGKNFPNPYITSMYSGMMFNGYC